MLRSSIRRSWLLSDETFRYLASSAGDEQELGAKGTTALTAGRCSTEVTSLVLGLASPRSPSREAGGEDRSGSGEAEVRVKRSLERARVVQWRAGGNFGASAVFYVSATRRGECFRGLDGLI
jgi:hypothetical protein